MLNQKPSKNNEKVNHDLYDLYNAIAGEDLVGAYLYKALFDEKTNELKKSIISFDGDLDDRIRKNIVMRFRLVLYSNLNSISEEKDKVNNFKSAYDQILNISKKTNDEKIKESEAELLEETKADLGLGLIFSDGIEELGCFLEKIKKILETLRIAVENADTYEEKLKEFLMNDVFIEILKNGFRSLKTSDLDIDEIYNKII